MAGTLPTRANWPAQCSLNSKMSVIGLWLDRINGIKSNSIQNWQDAVYLPFCVCQNQLVMLFGRGDVSFHAMGKDLSTRIRINHESGIVGYVVICRMPAPFQQ